MSCPHRFTEMVTAAHADGMCPLCMAAQIERLEAALAEDPSKWSWDVLEMVGRRLLDEVYPASVFDGSSGDPGPLYVVALRNALAALAGKELEPHAYVPSTMHMGDCAVCGHLQGAPIHSPFRDQRAALAGTEGRRTQVVGRVTGKIHEGDQVPGMPHAICHACGLKDYPCTNPDCPNADDALAGEEGT